MRNLTIKRNKTFVGCAGKLRVYIEDAALSEIVINDIGCRKLGELKNGEEKTFEIAEGAAKVFVIADQLSKSFCNEYYDLPEGQEDIALSGQCKFNPAAGNAFRFDGNNSAEVLANRKKSTAKGTVVMIVAIVFGLIGGFLLSSLLLGSPMVVKEKTFTSQGVSITLTNEFHKTGQKGFVAAYRSREVFIAVQKEAFRSASGLEEYTLEQYLNAMVEHNADKLGAVTVKETDGLIGFVSKGLDSKTNQMCHYYYYAYKSDDAFWLIQFAVTSENAEEYEQRIIDWAKSVKFSE